MSSRLLAVLLVAAATSAAAQPTGTPPDPRRGERLDGRPPPRDPFRVPRAIGRAVLTVPRVLIDALLWPVVRVAEFAERHHVVQRTYWAFTSEDRLIGLRPEARYETGLIASLGVRYFDRRSLGPGSLFQLLLRSGGPRFIYGELRLRAPRAVGPTVELRASFSRNESQLFAGTRGEKSAELRAAGRAPAHYGGDAAHSELLVTGDVADVLRLSAAAALDVRTYRSSDGLDRSFCAAPRSPGCAGVDDAVVPGFHRGLRVVRAGAGAVIDTRRGQRRLAGFRFALDAAIVHGVLGDPSFHMRAIADVRVVLDLIDRALILRLDAGHVTALGDAPVPFEELLSPSGNDGLRGMSYGRLRGASQFFGVLEYRWLLAPYLDASLFFENGGAFGPSFEGFSVSRMIPGYGVGLRVHQIRGDYWNAAPLLFVQIAHSPGEGARFMIGLGSGEP